MAHAEHFLTFGVEHGATASREMQPTLFWCRRPLQEFLLVRPTKKNLELYEGWIRSPTQSQVFFGDLADTCYRSASTVCSKGLLYVQRPVLPRPSSYGPGYIDRCALLGWIDGMKMRISLPLASFRSAPLLFCACGGFSIAGSSPSRSRPRQ